MKLKAKKSLGQHFLNSRHVLEQIITAAHIQKGESVLEIGPGTGFLTQALLKSGANVIAVEKDDRAYKLLEEKFSVECSSGQLKLIPGDILEFNLLSASSFLLFEPEGSSEPERPSPYSLVANIPYYITGAILEKFLGHGPRPDRMVLLVQKEVAERIVAKDRKESILSISVKAFGTPRIIAKVPRGAFTPAPTVDSAILSISDISDKRFKKKNVAGIEHFFEIVRAGFAHKRKFLKRNLETIMPAAHITEIWKKIGLDEKVRAENVTLEQWIGIFRGATS